MDNDKTGGMAFPNGGTITTDRDGVPESFDMNGGITVRDWFAVNATERDIELAIDSVLKDSDLYKSIVGNGIHMSNFRAWARYVYADIMIAERIKANAAD